MKEVANLPRPLPSDSKSWSPPSTPASTMLSLVDRGGAGIGRYLCTGSGGHLRYICTYVCNWLG